MATTSDLVCERHPFAAASYVEALQVPLALRRKCLDWSVLSDLSTGYGEFSILGVRPRMSQTRKQNNMKVTLILFEYSQGQNQSHRSENVKAVKPRVTRFSNFREEIKNVGSNYSLSTASTRRWERDGDPEREGRMGEPRILWSVGRGQGRRMPGKHWPTSSGSYKRATGCQRLHKDTAEGTTPISYCSVQSGLSWWRRGENTL